jgi:hypothetical protein
VAHRIDALIRRIYSGGFAWDAYAPNVVWHVQGNHPLAGEYRGRGAVFEAFCAFEERSQGTIRTIVVSILSEDEYALAVIHATESATRETMIALNLTFFGLLKALSLRLGHFLPTNLQLTPSGLSRSN